MKKAVIVFLWIAIVAAILGILDSVLFLVAPEGELGPEGIAYEIGYMIGSGITIWFSLSTLKIVKNATRASDISTGRKVAALFLASPIVGILMFCLKDKHFGYESAPASSTEEDAYAKLTKLKSLYESGAISEEEYLAEKAKILG